jgi:hypothetical protein
MNEEVERKLYEDWLHKAKETIIDEWQAWQARAALAQPEPAAPTVVEPDMRHPKIQRLIGGNARRDIEIGLIEQLLEDPDCELTSMDMEYWGPMHDKLREKLLFAHPPRTALTDAEIDEIASTNLGDYEEGKWHRLFARAIEAAHGIGG